MIQIRDLSVSYGPRLALDQVSLEVTAGECVLVTGPSGCGKSTLARVLTGLIPHAIPAGIEGLVRVAGLEVREQALPVLAQRIGAVFQNPASQLFHLRVEDELAFGPRNLGLSTAQVGERVEWALNAVGLADLRDCRPAELSGGQKQRVAIAAALAMQPQVLVLDEPTASLDVPGMLRVVATLQQLRERYGMTLVIIEHRLAEVARLADRTIVLEAGRIAAQGAPEQVFGDRELLRRLGLRRPVEENSATWDRLLMPDGHPSARPPLIELHQVSAGYGHDRRRPVIQDVSLALYPGDFAALVGDNGVGKSTLALVMAGLLKVSGGQVCFNGGRKPRPGLDVCLLFQNPADQLFTDSVGEEIAFGPRNYGCFDQQFHNRVLAEADLASLCMLRPVALSAGQQQRTALAACLALQPRLLILDEPTLGQDWGHLQQLMNFLACLNRQGTTILLITHDYKLIHHYARRVFLMEAGRIRLDGCLRPHSAV